MGNCLSPSTEQLVPISDAVEEDVKVFTMEELKTATKDFAMELVIEETFGRVLKGCINPNGVGMAVAVKPFYIPNQQALQDWLVDLEFLKLNSHPSLVKLIGYGFAYPLFSRKLAPLPYKWHLCRSSTQEFHICNEVPYISSVVNEPARFHYSHPEYICTGVSYMAGDVYSFGVILLEILTGFGKQRIILAKRAIKNDKQNTAEVIDPDLENYPLEAGRRMCKLIKQCLEGHPKKRPSMQQVLDHLNTIARI